MKTALITGANKGIGLETARQLLKLGYKVFLGSRDLEKGTLAAKQLISEGFEHVDPILIDVDNDQSIKAARESLGSKTDTLDVLINNAGIAGAMPQTALETDIETYRQVFQTNYFGVVLVTQVFIDLLKASQQPRIVNVSSSLGSLTLQSDPTWKYYHFKVAAYVASKAALNAHTIALAYELKDTSFKVNAVDPGYTATDINQNSAPGTVEDAAARVVKAAVFNEDGPTGGFFSEENFPDTEISPW